MVSDRFTGARNPARLPTTIQSRRIRCAPTWKPHGGYYVFILPLRAYNRDMRTGGFRVRSVAVAALLLCSMAAWAAVPMTKLDIVVTTDSGRPIDRASVVVRFVEGHSIVKLGKAVRTSYELRTNQEGHASIPEIPQGKIRIQVIAHGYQTFGQIFDVTEEHKTIDIKLNPPQQQYSAH